MSSPTVQPVWVRRTALPDGEPVETEWVRCPVSCEPVSTARCATCPRFAGVRAGPDGPLIACEVGAVPVPTPTEHSEDIVRLRHLAARLETRLAEVVEHTVRCLDAELTLDDAVAFLEREGQTCAPVVDDRGVLVGDIERVQLSGARTSEPEPMLLVEDVMRPPVALDDGMTVREAIAILRALRADGLPVVSAGGAVVGMLSLRAILGWVAG